VTYTGEISFRKKEKPNYKGDSCVAQEAGKMQSP
jgi:hypothetical protein